jgi:hypothetical protein
MKLLTADIRKKLLHNGRLHQQCDEAGKEEPDFVPLVKLFTPDAGCTWLLTEIDPENPDIAFGLCDLGMAIRNSALSACPNWSPCAADSICLSSAICILRPPRRCLPTPTRRGRMARSKGERRRP